MKVVGTSNFDNETVSDILVRAFLSLDEANHLAAVMNNKEGENSTYYYKVVEDDYKLYSFEP